MHSQLHDLMYRATAADRLRSAPRAALSTQHHRPPPIRGRAARIARRISSPRKATA